MLKFVKAAEVANDGGLQFVKQPTDTRLNGGELATLTHMVINRFLEGVDWDSVVDMYLSGLADQDDRALIQRAVKGLMQGGIAYA